MNKVVLAVLIAAIAISVWLFLRRDPSEPAEEQATRTERLAPVPAAVVNGVATPTPVETTATLESSDDFASLLLTAEPAAAAGVRDAAALVARILEYCYFYTQSPSSFEDHVRSLRDLNAGSAAALDRVAAKVSTRCRRVSSDRALTADDLNAAQEQAAKLGDLRSLVRTATTDFESMSDDERGELFFAAIESRDPAVILDAAQLVAFARRPEGSDLPVSDEDIDRYAWEVAACRLGAPCWNGQAYMDALCLAGANCSASSYEDQVRTDLIPHGSAPLLERKVKAVLAFARKAN